jgi:addiction module HigA family antidote
MPAPVLRRILGGEGYVYAETAIRFALVTGTAPEYWLNLQLAVDLWDAHQRMLAAGPLPELLLPDFAD